MSEAPSVSPKQWITVEGHECVVMIVYPKGSAFGVCSVVFNKQKPTTRDVDWSGTAWFFPDRSDFGGYGRAGDPFVEQLKRGR